MQSSLDRALRGRPSVLVVDDEPLMRQVVALIIEEHGGQAVPCNSGRAAIALLAREPDRFQCAIVDFSMPDLDGYQTLVELRSIVPTLGIVMVSGLPMTSEVEKLHRVGDIVFMSKPFRHHELVDAINAAIGAGGPTAS